MSPRAGVPDIKPTIQRFMDEIRFMSLKQSEWECSKSSYRALFIFPIKAETAAGILFSVLFLRHVIKDIRHCLKID